jgi:uncharacterized protein (TIGR00251 family)
MYLKATKDGVILSVRVTPNASSNRLTRVGDDCLGVRLSAPPIEGRANKELIKFLAKKAGVPKSSITIVRGRASRDKILLISSGNPASLQERLDLDL